MDFGNITINWLGHSGFVVAGSRRLIFDPYNLKADPGKADFLFITHEHFDHCSLADLAKVADPHTVVFCATECVSKITKVQVKNIIQMRPGESKEYEDIRVETVPAYNINKFRAPGMPFHPKDDGKLGFIVTLDSKRIYHAGDTDATPEMKALKGIDIAFVPVSGTYVMTPDEAAAAVNTFRPKLAIPMHYGDIVGKVSDAEKFKTLAKVSVEILELS